MPTDEGSALQLRLSLSSNTSFKRSFQELFGGAESDGEQGDDPGVVGVSHGTTAVGHAGRLNGREGRNKRQRSESQSDNSSSSASADADSSSSSLASSLAISPRSSTSGTTDNRISGRTPTRSSLPNGTQEASLPPRLPTPRLDDVQMSDIPLLDEDRDDEHLTHAALQAEAAAAPASGLVSGGSTPSHSQRSEALDEHQYPQHHQQQYQHSANHSSSSSSSSSSSAPSLPSPFSRPSTVFTASNHPTGSAITNQSLDLAQLSNGHATTSIGPLGLGLFLPSGPGPTSLSVSRNSPRTGPSESEERLRATMERYTAFESAIAALRRSVSPPPPRGLDVEAVPMASPPRLPPLELSSLRDVEGDDGGELRGPIQRPEIVAAISTMTTIDNTSSPARHTHTGGLAHARTHANLGLPLVNSEGDHTADRDEDDELNEFGEGSDNEDGGDEVLLNNHQHQHARLAHVNGASPHDAPPRIDFSNSLWSSLGISSSRRNSIAVVEGEHVVTTEMEGREGEQDDLVYPDPPFRDRLDSALEALRSPSSPLVPGLESVDSTQYENSAGLRPGSSSASLPSGNDAPTPEAQILSAGTPSNTAAGPSRSNAPPTLPPILTDATNSEWRRDLPLPHDRNLRRVSREEYDRRTLQRLGEVQVPSPSLSGFYDWLEGASANVPISSTRPGPTSGLNMETNAETQAPTQDQGSEPRSWEEDVLAGFMNTDLGLNLGLPQRDREEHVPLPPANSLPSSDTRQSAVDGVVMDVDMESDAEREREVESLHWTLGSSISSPNRPLPRLNFNREPRRPMQSMPEQYRRLNLLHDEWDPVPSQGHRQTETDLSSGPGPGPGPSTSVASLPTFSSSLFSSPSPPPSTQPTAATYRGVSSSTSPSRQNLSSSSSGIRLPSSILSPRRSSAWAGNTTSPSRRTSLPPSLSLDLGLSNSVFDPSTAIDPDNADATPFPDGNGNGDGVASPESTRRDSITDIFEPPPPRPHWTLRETLFAADSARYRAPTRVLGSSNSLMAEHAAEMRRRHARAELVRRLGASQRLLRSSLGSGSGSSLSSSVSGESGANLTLQSGASESGDGTGPSLWEHQNETGREGITGTRENQGIGMEERDERRAQPQTQLRFEHSQSQRDSLFGTFGGLGLPPRNSSGTMGGGLHESRDSESGSSVASSRSISHYPGVVPPPPRPRLHSVRRVLPPTIPEPAGHDSSPSNGHRSTSSSLGATNTLNNYDNANENRSSESRPITSGEAFIAMLGLHLPPDHENSRPLGRTHVDPESDRDSNSANEWQPQRNTRTSIDSLGSSDSSMSSESLVGSGYGSGVSSASVYGGTTAAPAAPGRAVFLDTELPSPGLGGLFDTLGSSTTSNNPGPGNTLHFGRNSFDLPPIGATGFSSAPLSTPASATTFNSSGSSGYFSPLGRFTPSPVRTSDEDAEEERSANGAQRLATRFRNTRGDMVNEIPRWWDQGWDEESAPEAGEMDVDGNQQNTYVNQTTNDQNRSQVERRPSLQDSRLASSALPSQSDFALNYTRARNPSPESRHIIDPTLFAPGPFRNTMETLAMRARDYAARASSSSAASRAATAMSSPVMSLSTPLSSSVSPPATNLLPPRSALHLGNSISTQGATAQLPPVIPPLSFENVIESENAGLGAQGDRSEARHSAENAARQSAARHPILRQGRLGDYLRWHEERRRREAGSAGGVGTTPRPTLFRSSSSVSSASSDGMPLSWSHLERSPERSESGASTHAPAAQSPTAASATGRGGSGEVEGLQHAIGVMRGDGLSLERSLQFWRGFYRDQMRGRTSDIQDETQASRPGATAPQVQNRNHGYHTRTRGSRSPHVPRWRHGHQTNTTTTTTSTTVSNITGPPPNTDRTRSRLAYPSWHEVVLNRPSSMEDVLEDMDSESEDDEDFEALLSLPRPPAAAPVGPRAPRLESASGLPSRYRVWTNASSSSNNSGSGLGSGPGSVGVRSGSGNGGRGESGPPHVPRILRERMIHRYRPPTSLGAGGTSGGAGSGPGTGGGRRFGGFARRFGNMGDYVSDEDFDASYESLLSLQAALGDVKPRSTPEAVLKRLKSAKYREWVDEESDSRCPICLDEYAPDDMVMRSGNCKHWLHKACLEQWLKTANTCPVCRTDVEPRPAHHHPRCPRHRMFPPRRDGPGGSRGGGSNGPPGSGSNNNGGSDSRSNAGSNPGPTSPSHRSRFGGGPFM